MQPAELAQRLASLDWSATSLQHQLAVSAAVETLGGKPLHVPYPHQVGSPYFDGAEAFECYQNNVITLPVTRWTRLYHLDGTLWASASHFGPEGAWGWVLETVAAEHGVGEEQISSGESDETQPYDCDDLVTVDGVPVYRVRHTSK